jgi:hypothetical protein
MGIEEISTSHFDAIAPLGPNYRAEMYAALAQAILRCSGYFG